MADINVTHKMKIAAVILILFGLGNLVGVFPAVQGQSWRDAFFAVVLGGALIATATGILTRKAYAWPLGFFVIGLSALYFVLSVLPFVRGKEGIERSVLLASCGIGASLVAAYWSRVWYRQRRYFSNDEQGA